MTNPDPTWSHDSRRPRESGDLPGHRAWPWCDYGCELLLVHHEPTGDDNDGLAYLDDDDQASCRCAISGLEVECDELTGPRSMCLPMLQRMAREGRFCDP